MSRSLTVTGVYKNGKHITVGLFQPKGAEFGGFNFNHYRELIGKIEKWLTPKEDTFKRIEAHIEVSTTHSEDGRITQDYSWTSPENFLILPGEGIMDGWINKHLSFLIYEANKTPKSKED